MNKRILPVATLSIVAALFAGRALLADPPTTQPAKDAGPEKPPAGATVLFDGTEASLTANWTMRPEKNKPGAPAMWPVADGAMTSTKRDIVSNEKYGDFKLHVEFCEPVLAAEVKGQERGNSGVYLQGRYEIQVLDSYGLKSKKDDCGAVYNIKAPSENACKPPGEWQTYDITFTAAKYDADGKKTADPVVTVVQNGTKVQDETSIPHATGSEIMKPGPTPGPILLQYHNNGVRFRNVWIVPGPVAK